jgi:hypothetical protein
LCAQSSKWKFRFTSPNQILELNFLIYTYSTVRDIVWYITVIDIHFFVLLFLVILINLLVCLIYLPHFLVHFGWLSHSTLYLTLNTKEILKYIKQNQRYIHVTKMSDTSITVIYHHTCMSLNPWLYCIFLNINWKIYWTVRTKFYWSWDRGRCLSWGLHANLYF